MKNGRGERREASASPSRVLARKYARRRSFALMSVGARHTAPAACGRARARKTRLERRDQERQTERKGKRERERQHRTPRASVVPSRAHMRTKTAAAAGRCHALPSAASVLLVHHFTGSLPRRSFLFPGPSPPPPSPSSCTLFPSSPSVARGSEYCHPFSSPVHLALFLPCTDKPDFYCHPSSCTVTRMHARTPKRGRAPKRTTGLVTCSLADSQRSYSHRRHLA